MKTNQSISTPALVILVIISLLASVIFLPGRVVEIFASKDKLTAAIELSDQLWKKLDLLSNLDEKQLNDYYQRTESALPSTKKTSGLVLGFSKLASASAGLVSVFEFSPGRVSTESGKVDLASTDVDTKVNHVKAIPVTVKLIIGYDQMIDLLKILRTQSQILTVTQVNYEIRPGVQPAFYLTVMVNHMPLTTDIKDRIPLVALTDEQKQTVSKLPLVDIFRLPEE